MSQVTMQHTVFNDDPLYLKNLIGRTVSVETVDKRIHLGTVYVVDPVYKTVVLIDKNTNRLEFVFHQAIKSFTILPNIRDEELLRDFNTATCGSEEANFLKEKLVKWLKHMFIDVKEDGEMLRVEDHLIICPPYGKDECMCDNTIVLERIRNIIDLMPSDFM